MKRIFREQPRWRELTREGMPEAFILVKPLICNGVLVAAGDPFPGASDRRTKLLYEQRKIVPKPKEEAVKEETKPKAKKQSKEK